jgi:D-cysteine desulfhydrase
VRLETSPSPVQRLEHLGHGNLWIKREDILSTVYGGNKVRKLEFVLADAIEKHRDRVVTLGALGTNHGLATAIFCQRLGLGCTLLLFDQPVTSYVRRNLLLDHKYGAELVHSGNLSGSGSTTTSRRGSGTGGPASSTRAGARCWERSAW